jgi:hypothetical protein
MEPYVARAFLNKLLSEGERADLRKFEEQMQGRYLQGFEICRRYNLKLDPLPEADIQRMDLLLWKWKRAWEVKFDSLGDEPFNVNGDHVLGDLWDWERFAEDNYVDVLPDYRSMASLAIIVMSMIWTGGIV